MYVSLDFHLASERKIGFITAVFLGISKNYIAMESKIIFVQYINKVLIINQSSNYLFASSKIPQNIQHRWRK